MYYLKLRTPTFGGSSTEPLDYPLVEKTAHKIKGGAVYVGTIRMKYACQYVERYWKTGQRELFAALYHQAVSTIEETITYIEGWLQRNTP
ncbi:Hpt domain-containing protein [uncultured Legionella sp.]|uniref:Hpt domain-containing protein n=1 Tax=uncultured Legionella sp. TaxID=210934 RepID=UPI00345D4D5A